MIECKLKRNAGLRGPTYVGVADSLDGETILVLLAKNLVSVDVDSPAVGGLSAIP